MEYDVAYDCVDPTTGRGGQCGEWYNDAVGIKNGTRVGNSYNDPNDPQAKTKFINRDIIPSDDPNDPNAPRE
jgi:hypothetical protein